MAVSSSAAIVPTVSTQPYIVALNAALQIVLPEIAAALPLESAPTAVLLALEVNVNTAIQAAQALVNVAALSTVASDVSAYLWAMNVFGSLEAIQQALAVITGTSALPTVYNGTDLFTIASRELGDWTRWVDILAINPQITDAFIDVPTSIILPPARDIVTAS